MDDHNNRWDHRDAWRLLYGVLDAVQYRPVDVPGAAAGSWDFELTLTDKRVIAVEVTRATDERQAQQWAEIRKRNWEIPGLRYGWAVTLGAACSIKDLSVGAWRL